MGTRKDYINRLGYKSHITSISRRAPNRYFISLADTVARRTWKINTKKEGQLACKPRSHISRGRGEVGQVRGTFFNFLRVCMNPEYHERPDRASHSRNAEFGASRTVFTLHGTASQPDMWASLKPPRPFSTYSLVRYSIERCNPSSVSSLLVCECFLECERGFRNQSFRRSASESLTKEI